MWFKPQIVKQMYSFLPPVYKVHANIYLLFELICENKKDTNIWWTDESNMSNWILFSQLAEERMIGYVKPSVTLSQVDIGDPGAMKTFITCIQIYAKSLDTSEIKAFDLCPNRHGKYFSYSSFQFFI